MKCKDCIYFQKVKGITQVDLRKFFGKRYTIEEITALGEEVAEPLYDCPYAEDWREGEFEANMLCENKFKKRP